MAKNRARENERNLMTSSAEYSYVADSFGGVDFTSLDGKCSDRRFPFLVNMYRDRTRQNGAALETIPGYREISKQFGESEGEIYGIFSHTFLIDGKRTDYVLVHKGDSLFVFSHGSRDVSELLAPIATLAAAPSCGFSYGEDFYLLDGENILRVSSPTKAEVLGDAREVDSFLEDRVFPETNEYIPTAFSDGKPYEARNMLTEYFDVQRVLKQEDVPDVIHGLKFRYCYDDEDTLGLEVIGLEEGHRTLVVPETATYNGETLPILKIAAGAFAGRDITMAILSPNIKKLEGNLGMGNGTFYGCTSLERAVLYGVEHICSDAFAFCSSLKMVVFSKKLKTIDSHAFYYCSSLREIYCEQEDPNEIDYIFNKDTKFYPSTRLFWDKVGKRLQIPCHPLGFLDIYTLFGAEHNAIGEFIPYDGVEDVESGLSEGFFVPTLGSTPLVHCYMKGVSEAAPYHHVFITVVEDDGMPHFADELATFRIALSDDCRGVAFVTLDGEEISTERSDKSDAYYSTETRRESDGNFYTALRVTLPYGKWASRKIVARCYGQSNRYTSLDLSDYRSANPLYQGTSLRAIRRCRFATVFDGRVFLAGNPELPDTVFYSVPSRQGKGFPFYFAQSAFCTCRDTPGTISALLAHPAYLAVMKEAGVSGSAVYYVTAEGESELGHPLYRAEGKSGAPDCVGCVLHFRDEPVFLSQSGLFAITSGEVWEEGRIEKRSHYVDGMLCSLPLSSSAMAEWKEYLVLLCEGKIFLGDSLAIDKVNGVTQYEWYFLDGIGRYEGQTNVYHHLLNAPTVNGKRLTSLTVGGEPLYVLGDKAVCDTPVLTAFAEEDGVLSNIEVHYTVLRNEFGQRCLYLVDCDGEMHGGVFSPATTLLSLRGVLYFGTKDGHLFCFNTDKRGIPPMIGGKEQPVLQDEIHTSWYTFDQRAYPSGLVTAFCDMGAPHVAKTTSRGSLTVKAKTMPHSSFEVSVRTDRGGFHKVGSVVATDRFCEKDFAKESFSSEDRVRVTLHEHERRWVEKQFLFYADVFCSPFGIDAFAYRYRMAGRPVL